MGSAHANFKVCAFLGHKIGKILIHFYPIRHISPKVQQKFTKLIFGLKVLKCEIFDPFLFTPINSIWLGDLRTREKKKNF